MSTRLALRRTFVRGIFLILPLAITFGILGWLFSWITGFSTPVVTRILGSLGAPLQADPMLNYLAPLMGLVLTGILILLAGFLGGHYLGRTLLAAFDRMLLRVPVVKWVYGSARQLMDAFSATGSGAFREVVFVEYPRRGIWGLGFVTASAEGGLPSDAGRDAIYVFLPTSPNPTSGFTLVVDRAETVPAGMTVEEGLKLIVSGGFIAPGPRGAESTGPNRAQGTA